MSEIKTPEQVASMRAEWDRWLAVHRPTIEELNSLIEWAMSKKHEASKRLTGRWYRP
jgi:hypothetical protein